MKSRSQASRREAEHRQREIDFIVSLSQWPLWPVLPLKRNSQHSGEGFLYADNARDEDGVKVYLANVFRWSTLSLEQRKAVEVIEYKTVAEMLDAGWRVD